MSTGNFKRFGPIGCVEIGSNGTQEAANEYSKFAGRNPKMIAEIWNENKILIDLIHSQADPSDYLEKNPETAKTLGLSNNEILAVLNGFTISDLPIH